MKVTICIGSSCHLKGSKQIIEGLQYMVDENGLEDRIDLCGAFCMKNCVNGVSVSIDDEIFSVTPEKIREFFDLEIQKRL